MFTFENAENRFSRIEDTALLLIIIKLFQWEFVPSGGKRAECKEQKEWGLRPVKSQRWRNEGKGGKRLKHEKQRRNVVDGTESTQQAREGGNGLLHVIWKRRLFLALS